MTSMAELMEREREKRQWAMRRMATALSVDLRHYRDWLLGQRMLPRTIHRVYLILGLDPEEVINSTFEPFTVTYQHSKKGFKKRGKIIDQPWVK